MFQRPPSPSQNPPVFPCNEDILPVGRLMVTRRDGSRRTRTLATPQAISHRIYLFSFFSWWKESLFTVWMSQVNPIPRSNGISDGEQIALRWCWTGQETLEKKKIKAPFYTIEDTAVIFAVSRVFIIDFPPQAQWLANNKRTVIPVPLCCTLMRSMAQGGWP